MNKINILISYPAMMTGGSTTSLLSILDRLDYNKYEVDLLLDVRTGELLKLVPQYVNILPSAYKYPNHKIRKIFNILSPSYMNAYFKSKRVSKRSGNYREGVQFLESSDVENYRSITNEYDIAIAFLEGKNCKFVANHISAKKKIAWVHIDYKASGFNPKYDLDAMSKFDKIVTVSQSCKDSFDECFPSLSCRTCVIENILSANVIRERSKIATPITVDKNYINLVTTCRIVFSSKGLNRAVLAIDSLRGKQGFDKLRWYIIGDGPDMFKLKQLISEHQLTNHIFLLGNQANPYSYMKDMDMFFLPSLWEGKPMAVTEAFMLGLPVLATKYLSAPEQINDGTDGIITDNSQEGIKNGLQRIIEDNDIISKLRQNVISKDYSNDEEMSKIYQILTI
ncbi:MAG: glycosyltransferase [Muribaculum sp.]|nr:glycosyltransferase [Muribaculum sp.]